MRPRKLLRIARWETTTGVGGVDRGAVAVVLAAVAFVGAVGVVGFVGGVAVEDGIYRVGVDEERRFHAPAAEDLTSVRMTMSSVARLSNPKSPIEPV